MGVINVHIQVLSDDGCTILFDSRWKYPEEFGFTKGTPEYAEVTQMYYDRLHLALPQFEAIKVFVENGALIEKDEIDQACEICA